MVNATMETMAITETIIQMAVALRFDFFSILDLDTVSNRK